MFDDFIQRCMEQVGRLPKWLQAILLIVALMLLSYVCLLAFVNWSWRYQL